jgi:hypothetical protein
MKNKTKYQNLLALDFEEKDGMEILGKVLKYIHNFDLSYYYLIFGDFMGGYDLESYKEKYSLLGSEEGVIKLNDEDIENTRLIYNVLNSYHSADLYINNDADFISDLTNEAWRKPLYLKSGFSVDMLVDYINFIRTDDVPEWDLKLLNI